MRYARKIIREVRHEPVQRRVESGTEDNWVVSLVFIRCSISANDNVVPRGIASVTVTSELLPLIAADRRLSERRP